MKNLKTVIFVYLALWLVLSVRFIALRGYQITTLDGLYNQKHIKLPRSEPMIAGDKAIGEFSSKFSNLSGITVKFNQFDHYPKDRLQFRFKPINQDSWYYLETINTNQIRKDNTYTFNIPRIRFSNQREYIFELESLQGATESGVTVNMKCPSFIARHMSSKDQISDNHGEIVTYIFDKVINIFSDGRVISQMLIYLMPLAFVLTIFIFGDNFAAGTYILFVAIIGEIILSGGSHDFIVLSVVIGWLALAYRSKFASTVTVSMYFLFVLATTFFLVLKQYDLAERTGMWMYLFLACSAITTIAEIYFNFRVKQNAICFWRTMRDQTVSIDKIIFPNLLKQMRKIYEYVNSLADAHQTVDPFFSRKVYKSIPTILFLLTFLTVSKIIISRNIIYFRFFQNYFLKDATVEYLSRSGIYLLIYLFFILALFSVLYIKLKKLKKVVIIGLLLASFYGSNLVFDITTKSFRDTVKIWEVKPNGFSEAWVDVNIEGVNFSGNNNGKKVVIDGVEQRIIRWTDNEIIFRTDPNTTKTGDVSVLFSESGQTSNSVHFDYHYNR